MLKNIQTIKRYSESFKLKLLDGLSSEKYTKRELSRIYGFGASTIADWIHKYKREDLLNTRLTVGNMDELSRIHELEKELANLKELLIKKILNKLVLDSYLKVAAQKPEIKEAEELKIS
jgi:transposase-like protein